MLIAVDALECIFYTCHIKYFQNSNFISLISLMVECVSLITYLLNFSIFLSENKLFGHFFFFSHSLVITATCPATIKDQQIQFCRIRDKFTSI